MKETPWGHIVSDARPKLKEKETKISMLNPKLWPKDLLQEIYDSDKRLKTEFVSFDSYYSYYQEITGQK